MRINYPPRSDRNVLADAVGNGVVRLDHGGLLIPVLLDVVVVQFLVIGGLNQFHRRVVTLGVLGL